VGRAVLPEVERERFRNRTARFEVAIFNVNGIKRLKTPLKIVT
jgi:hypothetical protein